MNMMRSFKKKVESFHIIVVHGLVPKDFVTQKEKEVEFSIGLKYLQYLTYL